jgi:DNA methylase
MVPVQVTPRSKPELNKILAEDRPIHDWYRFVLSYPPHLVRTYLQRFAITNKQRVLDPFCGTGTTLVECKKLGIASFGLEANPMACLASRTKTNWEPNPDKLLKHAQELADKALAELQSGGVEDEPFELAGKSKNGCNLQSLSAEEHKLLLTDSISPLPLHKTLVLRAVLEANSRREFRPHLQLAFAKAIVYSISNLHFGPEVGMGPPKSDVPVVAAWLAEVRGMVADLRRMQGTGACPRPLKSYWSRNL